MALAVRGLDFALAGEMFSGSVMTFEDSRANYSERRLISVGTLGGRTVALVWTPCGDARRMVNMRRANDRQI